MLSENKGCFKQGVLSDANGNNKFPSFDTRNPRVLLNLTKYEICPVEPLYDHLSTIIDGCPVKRKWWSVFGNSKSEENNSGEGYNLRKAIILNCNNQLKIVH